MVDLARIDVPIIIFSACKLSNPKHAYASSVTWHPSAKTIALHAMMIRPSAISLTCGYHPSILDLILGAAKRPEDPINQKPLISPSWTS